MRSLVKQVMSEYNMFIVKIGEDMVPAPSDKIKAKAANNFDFVVDIEVLLSLSYFIPLLNAVYYLIKLFQARDIFIHDFLTKLVKKSWLGNLLMESWLLEKRTSSNTTY